ncbi:MAG TPA: hypothetical protein VF787_20270 [Thermoanaerobaculia bacterium]
MASIFGTKEEILARIAGFERMNAWTDANSEQFTSAEAFAITDELYDLMTAEARAHHDDPRRDGARFMRAVLALLR